MGIFKNKAVWVGGGVLLVFALLIVGLFLLGSDQQSALEKLRDIAIIMIVLSSVITVILLAAITAALIFLVIQIKNHLIPALEETTGTVKRVRDTTNFVTEEAIRPILNVAGKYSRLRGMAKYVSGQTKKLPKQPN
jgi:hypothetical protein